MSDAVTVPPGESMRRMIALTRLSFCARSSDSCNLLTGCSPAPNRPADFSLMMTPVTSMIAMRLEVQVFALVIIVSVILGCAPSPPMVKTMG